MGDPLFVLHPSGKTGRAFFMQNHLVTVQSQGGEK